MSDQDQGSWTEYRLLILEVLERHEESLKEADQRYYQCRENMRDEIDKRFVILSDMHKKMIAQAKEEILAELKIPPEVQVAKITSTWEFRATMIASAASIIVALIALLK